MDSSGNASCGGQPSAGQGTTPFFSIIVPVHNGEATLARCVESVRGQNFEHWELLLVENSSADASWQICTEYAREDGRIRAMQCASGPSEARNIGIRQAVGEYLVFLDCDDFLCGDLEGAAAQMKQKDTLYFITQERLREDGEIVPPFYQADSAVLCGAGGKEAYAYLYGRLHIGTGPWLFFYQRSYVLQQGLLFPEEIYLGEDMCFVTNAVWSATSVRMLTGRMLCVSEHSFGSLSSEINPASAQNLLEALRYGQGCAQRLLQQQRCAFLVPYCTSALWMLCCAAKLPRTEQAGCTKTLHSCAAFLKNGRAARFVLPYTLYRVLGLRPLLAALKHM